jgi:hypothetical protein
MPWNFWWQISRHFDPIRWSEALEFLMANQPSL